MSTPPVVFDLEGGSVTDRWPARSDFVRLIGMKTPGGYGAFSGPMRYRVADAIGRSALAVGHNIVGFDLPVLDEAFPGSVDVLAMTREGRVWDTQIAEECLDPPEHDDRSGAIERARKEYGLDRTCARRGVPGKVSDLAELAYEFGDPTIRGKKARQESGYERIPVGDSRYLEYLQGDVQAAAALAGLQLQHNRPYILREHRIRAIAATMEGHGVGVDDALLGERHSTVTERKAALKARLVAEYGIPTTTATGKESAAPHSTKEGKAAIVAAYLSAGVREEDLPRTAPSATHPMGQYSFSGKSLLGENQDGTGGLAGAYRDNERVVALCEVVADMAGQRTVYGTALEHLRGDGRVHPSIAMLQASGRWSVTKPGMTVFGKRGKNRYGEPRVAERAIIRAHEGHVFVAADLAQIDQRAVAAHAQDPNYTRVFEEGRDLHSEVAARLWGGPDLDNPRRNDAKPMSHGYPYGMQAAKLADSASVPLADAENYHRFMRESFPGVVRWMEDMRELARGGVLDNGFGRLMRCNPRRAFTQGPALMGQGTARDLMMECLLRIDDLDPRVIHMLRIQVHDEIVLEVPEDEVEQVIGDVLKRAMTFQWAPPGASIPITVEVDISGYGRSWADCYAK